MLEQPQIIQVSAQPAAVIHITVPRDQIRAAMGPGYQELMETLAAQGVTPAGPWFTHHHFMDPEVFDFDIGVPIGTPVAALVTPSGRVQPGELPAARVARAVYSGSYEGLPAAWGEFDAWLTAQNLPTAPNLWEVYLAGPESSDDPAAWRTELNKPLV